eukprot:5578579-Pleurochrysis_carterae.AAC.4
MGNSSGAKRTAEVFMTRLSESYVITRAVPRAPEMNASNSALKHLGAKPKAFWVAVEGKHAITNGLELLVGSFVASQLLVRRSVVGQGGVRKAVADVRNVQKAVRPVLY